MDGDNVLDRVLFIGPSVKGWGGMEELGRLYISNFENAVYLPTNSCRGTLAGLVVLAGTVCRLPLYRLQGKSLMHIHMASGKSFFRKAAVAILGRMIGFKILIHIHAGDFPDFVKKATRPIVKTGLAPAHCVIVLSDYWRKYFTDNLGLKNVSVLPNMVESGMSSKEKENRSKTRFLYLGVLTRDKGVDTLVRAYKIVAECLKDKTELIIAGTGFLEQELKEFVGREITGGKVYFTGWVNHEERDRLLEQSDIIVLPSLFECQPMSLLEGMAAGCGIVATRIGGVPDIVRDNENGFLVEPGDVKGVADAMMRYVDNRSIVSKHGIISKKILEQHLPENVKKNLIKIYEGIN